MVVRSVKWPRDTALVARSLAKADAWFWLDGTAVEPGGSAGLSYLGEAAEALHAERGGEREYLQRLRSNSNTQTPGLGWVAAFSYEFGVALMGEDPAFDDAPAAFALRPSTVLVLDHLTGVAELRGESEAALHRWLQRHGEALEGDATPASSSDSSMDSASSSVPRSPALASPSSPRMAWRHTDEQYRVNVSACKEAIHDGEAYVLCLTDTAEVTGLEIDPLRLYLDLLGDGGAVRGAIIVTGDRALVSASPERFLSKRGQQIATHPIKGTRPRSEAPEADAILAQELAADPKERAENLMIVDLMRNDLSRVCVPGSVRTDGFLRVEQHPRVHQLVSTVRGQMRAEADIVDVLEACFPGGSMTGAPKRRAVQMLSEIEGRPRGLYSGCFGWLGDDGNAELAMSIRCIELRGVRGAGQLALVGAGGGVTSDSDPVRELEEKQLKAASILAALLPNDSEYP